MQIVCYVDIYQVKFPANVEIYIDQLTSLVEFDFLNPFKYATLADPKFRIVDWLQGVDSSEYVFTHKH